MKVKNKLLVIVLTTIVLSVFTYTCVLADVGSFESYDSDSGFSYSDYDYGYDYDYSGGYDSGIGDLFALFFFPGDFGGLIMLIIIILIIIYRKKSNNRMSQRNYYERKAQRNLENVDDISVVNKIKAVDPLFDREKFISWAKTLFVKLQEAWSARDWETIRTFETKELFEQNKKQLDGYIQNKQINVLERVCVKTAKLASFHQDEKLDVISVVLSSKMLDYIIDEETGKLLYGSKETEKHSVYKMVFVRSKGIKTQDNSDNLKTTNCPNCGAPTSVLSSGKCEYCGSIITTDKHDWVLSDLSKIK